MRSSANTGLLTSGLVITGGLLGLAVILRPGVAIPFTIEWVVLFAITAWLDSREKDPEARKWLRKLMLAALAVRVLALVGVHFGPLSPYFFAPDAIGYEEAGRQLSVYWVSGGPAPRVVGEGWRAGYWLLNGMFHAVFGESRFALVVLNTFAGVWTVLVTFHIGKEVVGISGAKAAAVLVGFFPSLVLWSVLNIRDALATLMVVTLVWAGLRLSKGVRLPELFLFGAALFGLSALRDYMAFLVLAGIAVGVFASFRADRILVNLALGTVITLVLTSSAQQLELFSSLSTDDVLSTAQLLRTGLQQGAGSAFGVGADTNSLAGAIQYLPLGAAFLLFAPFPWDINTPLQLAATPETLAWYPLFLLAVYGVWKSRSSQRFQSVVVPLSVLVIVTASYALVEGNFGTAYRHRAQIMPLFFIFTGAGWTWVNERVLKNTPWYRRYAARRRPTRRRLITPR